MTSMRKGLGSTAILAAALARAALVDGADFPKNVLSIHPYSTNGASYGCENDASYADCVSRILDDLPKGVDGIMIYDTADFFKDGDPAKDKAYADLQTLIDKAHAKGLSVGTGGNDVKKLVGMGADFIEVDEGFSNKTMTVGQFNEIKDAAKSVNPDVLVGISENPTSVLAQALQDGARPDFILNEVYAQTPEELTAVAALSKQYGIPAGTWLDDSGSGGHSIGYACDVHNDGLSVVYFNAGGYYQEVQDVNGCGGTSNTAGANLGDNPFLAAWNALAQQQQQSFGLQGGLSIPSVGDGTSACPYSDTQSCLPYLILAQQQQALGAQGWTLGIPAIQDLTQQTGGPLTDPTSLLQTAAQDPLLGFGQDAGGQSFDLSSWQTAWQAMAQAMLDAFNSMWTALSSSFQGLGAATGGDGAGQ